MKKTKRLLACTLIAALFVGFAATSASAATDIDLGKDYSRYATSWGLMEYKVGSSTTKPQARSAVELEIYDIGVAEAQVKTQAGWGSRAVSNVRGGYSGFFYSYWAQGTGTGITYATAQEVNHYGKYTSQLDPSDSDYFNQSFI